jgi:apolipoprotein N-acyltransferase
VTIAERLIRSRYLIAVISGVLLALSFPKLGVAGFAWVAPALMVAAAANRRGAERFRIGYVAGLGHYLTALYWLLHIPYDWHGIPVGPAAGWLALGAFLSLFIGLWVWLLDGFPIAADARRRNLNGVTATTTPLGTEPQTPNVAPLSRRNTEPAILNTLRWSLSGAALWVAIEMLIARIFTGFPWDLLGVSQHEILPLIQISSITGVYGVSFVVVWTSLSLYCAASAMLRHPNCRYAWARELALPFIAVACLMAFGFHQLSIPSPARKSIKVTFVQPSIPQTLIWDESRDNERFGEVLQLTDDALSNRCDLVLWPEAAVPRLLRWYADIREAVTGLAREHKTWMIIGADDMEPKHGSRSFKDAKFYNSSFLISPTGEIAGHYRKRALVIFGEYIPLVKWLPFIKYLTPIESGFTPGEEPVPFKLQNPNVKAGVLICFEDVFPHLTREYVDTDTDFLVNLTNNGWFGEGAAQWQHAMTALFRAVENGTPLLRCSNNGLTCWVDERGRVREIFHDTEGTVYGKGFMTADIPILAGARRELTFYTRHGDVFGWLCVAWSVVWLLASALRRRLEVAPGEPNP